MGTFERTVELGGDGMGDLRAIPHVHVSRRRFLGGLGAAAAAGTAVSLAGPAPAQAAAAMSNDSKKVFPNSSAPRPIEPTVEAGGPAPFDFIHWLLPGPPGATTQILELPAFGLDVDPSLMTDYKGFTAYAVISGNAHGSDGNHYDVELDVRVMDGTYVGEDGNTHKGTFGFF